MKIQQMAFMIMAVTIFFVLVGLFVLSIQLSGLKESANEIKERKAVTLAMKLANSPEFSCGQSFGSSRTSCVDADKVMALKMNSEKYENFWGIEEIEIRKIYPESEEDINCNLANYPNCNLIKMFSEEIPGSGTKNFISLCRKEKLEGDIYNKCDLAIITIGEKRND